MCFTFLFPVSWIKLKKWIVIDKLRLFHRLCSTYYNFKIAEKILMKFYIGVG
jgi:hypothetical protein